MADALHRVGQLTVGRNETLEIILADTQQIGVLDGADRGGARASAEQGHFSKGVSLAEHGDSAAESVGARLTICQNLHLSVRHNVEGITGVAGPEQNFVSLQPAIANTWQNSLDLVGWQMAHQVACRQQFYSLARI